MLYISPVIVGRDLKKEENSIKRNTGKRSSEQVVAYFVVVG